MSHSIEPVSKDDIIRLENCVKKHRSVGIFRVADELGWPAIKVLKVASANPRIQDPQQDNATTNILDRVGGISESIDFPLSSESSLLPHVTGLATPKRQEVLIDHLAKYAVSCWRVLPSELKTNGTLIDVCISLINRKTIHELAHVLGGCNEASARDAETIIPAKIGNATYEKPSLPVIDLTAGSPRIHGGRI